MDELVALVVQKTGLPEETAKKAVEIVIEYLKDKLPGPIAAQVDNALESKGLGEAAKGLGAMLGKK